MVGRLPKEAVQLPVRSQSQAAGKPDRYPSEEHPAGKFTFLLSEKHGSGFLYPFGKHGSPSCLFTGRPATRKRETRALCKLAKAFSVEKLLIITLDEEETIQQDGHTIQVIPIWKWLLA